MIEEKPAIKLEKMLVQGEVDIAILHLPIQDKGIQYDPISVEKIFLVAPPGYHIRSIKELKKQQKFDFNYLKDEKFILLKTGHRMRFVADELFKRAQFKPNILLEIRNLDTAYCLASAGMGFTLIPENIIMSLNTNQYENCFLIDDINFALVVAYRKGDYLTNAIREFITITKEIIGSKHKSIISDES